MDEIIYNKVSDYFQTAKCARFWMSARDIHEYLELPEEDFRRTIHAILMLRKRSIAECSMLKGKFGLFYRRKKYK